MIDKNNIKESGLLEQYLLGQLDTVQENEISTLINSDEELKAYFNDLETSFEKLGSENAIQPPKMVKDKLLDQIRSNALNDAAEIKRLPTYKRYFAIAASIAALLLLGNIWFFTQLNALKTEVKVAGEENSRLNSNIETFSQELENLNNWFTSISNPNVEQYVLQGNSLMPNAKAISYVNHIDKSVIVNTQALPKLDDDKDYQMWADVEGEMINMGLIDLEDDLIAMTYIDNAESLNITIEPKGGSEHPTVSQLISNVYFK